MHFSPHKTSVRLAQEFQKHLSNASRKNVVIDQGKYIKLSIKWKWTEQEYHVQEDNHMTHKVLKLLGAKTQFPLLQFCGTHEKPHGVQGLSKNCHILLDTKLGYVTCEIFQISCACSVCTSMLYKPWSPGVIQPNKPCFQPV